MCEGKAMQLDVDDAGRALHGRVVQQDWHRADNLVPNQSRPVRWQTGGPGYTLYKVGT